MPRVYRTLTQSADNGAGFSRGLVREACASCCLRRISVLPPLPAASSLCSPWPRRLRRRGNIPVGAGRSCRHAHGCAAGDEPAAGVGRQLAGTQPPPRAEFSLRRSGACRECKLRLCRQTARGREIACGRDRRRRQPHAQPPPPVFRLERAAARGLSAGRRQAAATRLGRAGAPCVRKPMVAIVPPLAPRQRRIKLCT